VLTWEAFGCQGKVGSLRLKYGWKAQEKCNLTTYWVIKRKSISVEIWAIV
jgi:hypothetical protein